MGSHQRGSCGRVPGNRRWWGPTCTLSLSSMVGRGWTSAPRQGMAAWPASQVLGPWGVGAGIGALGELDLSWVSALLWDVAGT